MSDGSPRVDDEAIQLRDIFRSRQVLAIALAVVLIVSMLLLVAPSLVGAAPTDPAHSACGETPIEDPDGSFVVKSHSMIPGVGPWSWGLIAYNDSMAYAETDHQEVLVEIGSENLSVQDTGFTMTVDDLHVVADYDRDRVDLKTPYFTAGSDIEAYCEVDNAK